ncbi:flagellar hook protein FlgE [Modicisalibacter radicis]|uniref:flagellar hook protein FlgE n=1 Tax=Halomonas sp. EAR18 TaxID=2518972 RepID=UPI00109C87C2|nr:flagellar hook protein FlgE [Halomonas sp. EAR18]
MGFSQALSGVNAASQQLDVVGNNIANSQTTGFKSSSVQFSDVFANSKIGLGTRVAGVVQDFGNGNLETTGRNLDLAISGTGFYRFEQEGQIGYSRNGQLTMTADGDLVNAQGAKIMGYGLAGGPFSEVVPGGQPVALNIPANDMPAQATGTATGVQAVYNLNQATDPTDPSKLNTVNLDDGSAPGVDVDYHYSNSFTVYDSLGNQRNATVYFEKAAAPANTWNGKVALDGFYDANNDFTLGFDTNGQLSSIEQGGTTTTQPNLTQPQVNFTTAQLGGDPADLGFELNLQGTTQFANDSTQNSLVQDGYTSGTLVGITIADDGTIMRNYTNEKSVAAGQIALANFRNPEGLKAAGDNMWAATAESGAEVVGTAGVGQFGSIESGTLEASNVDLTKELVDLIIAQRNYQANTNSIRTQSEVMDQIAQLR